MTPDLHIRTIVSRPFEENTYVVWLPGRSECVVIDPGLEPDLILDVLRGEGLTVSAVLNTHGHADHIGGNEALKEAFPAAPLIIGAREVQLLGDPQANLSAPFGLPITSPPADRTVAEGDVVEEAGLALEVLDVPGHSPGDVLFRGGIGRSDFPGGDGALLLAGIRTKLFTLPPDTVVYPGHGPATTVGREKATNPYVGDAADQ